MRVNGQTCLTLPAWAGIVLLSTIASVSLHAQTAGTGALTGTVRDATGAVIPGASVTATNADTAQERATATGADGSYRFTLLPPGTYRVRFAAAGFKSVEVPEVKVNVTETPVLDRSLEVGGQAEQVTVQAEAATIQTTNSTMGTVVAGNTATALPLTTRNYTNLLALAAGTNASVNNATGLGRGAQDIATNGGTTAQNNFQMDGVSITNYGSAGTLSGAFYATFGIPNPDSLAEFKIQTSLYDAGYGRNPGASVNVLTKSGTNSFHGTAFEFFRNTALNANDFFRNRTCGLSPASCAESGGNKLVLNQNQYGGTFGGPLKKDKLFFFASYQQTWQKNGAATQGFSAGITLPPVPLMDRGSASNPSQTAAFRAALGAAFCHLPTNPGGAGAGQGMQVACDGSNINPIAINYLQVKNPDGSYYIPASSIPGQSQSGVTYSIPAYDREYQGMLNLDYQISAKHTLSSRYYRSLEPQTINFFGGPNPAPVPGLPGSTEWGYHNGVLKLTSLLSNSLVNEARASIQRDTTVQTQSPPADLNTFKIFPNAPATGFLGGASTSIPPQLAFQGLFLAGGTNDVAHHNTQIQWADQVSWSHGKHTMRFGGEFESVTWNWVGSWLSHGIMAFQTFSDFLIGLPGACGSAVLPGVDPSHPKGCNGSAFSNVLNTNNFSVVSSPSGIVHGYRAKDGNWFVQDDIKVNQRLTLNLGLRWEYDGLPSDKYGNLVNVLPSAVLSVPVPGSDPAHGTYAGFVAPSNYSTTTYGPLPAGVLLSGHKIASRNDIPLDDFAPRVGFAWQPVGGEKFVVRGGYGFFFDRVPGNTIIHSVEQSPPYAPTLDQGPSTNQFSSLADPFQHIPVGTYPIRWVNFATGQGSDITQTSLADIIKTPLVYSWNLNLQYELAPRWVLEVGYVGSHGIHQPETLHVIGEAGLASPSNPVNGVTTNTVANARLRVPYLGFSPTGMQYADTLGDFKFNSLQTTLTKRLSYGLTFQGAYTFSRAFSDLTFPGTGGAGSGANLGDPNNLRQQYGLNPQYRPHRFVLNYNWAIPYGNLRGIAGKLLGGWSLAGVTTIQDGQPLSVTDSRGGGIFGLAGAIPIVLSRAQIASGKTYADIVTPGGVESRLGGASGGPGYFATSAFSGIPVIGADPTVAGTGGTGWGNSGVGIIFGPGQFNFDTTLAKSTRVGGIHEDGTLQFRAEFFNLLNHPQFNPPANNVAVGNFGQITSASVNPRLVQLALKYIF
jgi:hypothetical protein